MNFVGSAEEGGCFLEQQNLEQAELLKCYDWQIVNTKRESWTASLKREVGIYLAGWKRMGYKSNMSNDCQKM